MPRRAKTMGLNGVVLTKEDVKRVYRLMRKKATARQQQIDEARKTIDNPSSLDGYEPVIKVSVVSVGGVSTLSRDDSIFDDDAMDNLKTEKLSLRYYFDCHRLGIDEQFSFHIGEDRFGLNEVSVEADDATWVDATFSEAKDLASSFRPIGDPLRRSKGLTHLVKAGISLLLGYCICRIGFGLLNENIKTSILEVSPLWLAGSYLLFSYSFCSLPADALVTWFTGLWPHNEFQFGPEHQHRSRVLRNKLTVVGTLLFLPIAIELFFRLFPS